MFTPGSELGEDEKRIHLKTIHVNRSPAVAPIGTLTEEDAERLGISLEQCREHQQQLMSVSGVVEKVQDAFGDRTFEDVTDPDLMLYSGPFFSDSDRVRFTELRQMSPDDLRCEGSGFDDSRVPEMLFRFRARNYPDSLTPEEQDRWHEHRAQVSKNGEHIDDVLRRINEIEAGGGDRETLDDLAGWLRSRWATLL